MARSASRDFRTRLTSIVECSVCRETYSNPRQLPCVHSYCLKCITEFSKDKQPGDAVSCPLCRKDFTIPHNGVAGLPKNFFVEQLKELAGPCSTHCEVCSTSATEAATRKTATRFCVDCSERLCETCANVHGRLKVSRGHEVVNQDGSNDESSEARVRLGRVYCDKHPDEVLKLYCFDCKIAICMMCFVRSHMPPHKCSDINEVADDFRIKMTADTKNLVSTVTRCREVIEREKACKVRLDSKLDSIKREICDRVDKLKQLIDREKSNLMEEFETFKEERNKQVNNFIAEMEQNVSFVDSLITYIEQLRDKGRSSDVTQQRSTLNERVNELAKLDMSPRAVSECGSVDISFTAAALWSSSPDAGIFVGKLNRARSDDASKLTQVTKGAMSEKTIAADKYDIVLPKAFTLKAGEKVKVQEVRTGATQNNLQAVHAIEETKRLRDQMGSLRDRLSDLDSKNAQLARELEALRREKEETERRLTDENGDLKSEVIQLRAELEAIIKELERISDTKLGLELEIAAYRKLLEGEENRVGLRQIVEILTTDQSYNFRQVEATSGDASKVTQVTKGEMQAKTTYQRSAKGPVAIAEIAADGKFVQLENTGRKLWPKRQKPSEGAGPSPTGELDPTPS